MEGATAIITGITGQDGSYLRDLLLRKGYEVHGLLRSHAAWDSQPDSERLQLHVANLADADSLMSLMAEIRPHEVYHLAAQSNVRASFEAPLTTTDANAMGTLRLLEAVRRSQYAVGHEIRFFHASSSEIFAPNPLGPLTETSPIDPQSPYGISKACAHWSVRTYRETYGLYASNGILFNHESPLRPETFVTRKITKAVARIAHGVQKHLTLGALESQRDWGYAGDYVQGMWLMLQQEEPDDYLLATGAAHSVEDFTRAAFAHVGLDYRKYIQQDEKFLRPKDVPCRIGDPAKARTKLGWEPRVGFADLVKLMVEADLEQVARETRRGLRQAG